MKKLVFIVEDNIVQQKALQVHFEKYFTDYEIKAFDNPESMISKIGQKPYAVILDHLFGDNSKNGLYYLKILKDDYKSIPVIYYTTLDDDELKNEVLKIGAEQYIIKNSASLVNLRTSLDLLTEKEKKGTFFSRIFKKK